MENIIESEPVFKAKKTHGKHPEIFDQIRSRIKAKQNATPYQNGHQRSVGKSSNGPIIVSRARLVENDETEEETEAEDSTNNSKLPNGKTNAEIFDLLWEKVEEKRKSQDKAKAQPKLE